MNIEKALEFLKQHQPMPDDSELEKAIIDEYDEVRKFFLEHLDKRCIPLFLNSFGKGDGFGVYQLIEDVISKYTSEDVVPHIAKALENPHTSIRYWNAQIDASFPSVALINALFNNIREGDFDMRYACISALEQIEDNQIKVFLKE